MRVVGIGHIPEDELGPREKACSICGDEGDRPPEAQLQRDPDVWMRRCRCCQASSADRMPLPEALSALYAPDIYTPHWSAGSDQSRRLADRLARNLALPPDRDVAILDYGGNDGSLSRALIQSLRAAGHRARCEATVVDLFPRDDEDGIRYLDVDDFARSADRYDVLMASAVLEHLPDCASVTRRITAAGRPGALFWARSPYDLPLARLPVGFPVLWPRHLHDFGPAFWSRFLDTFGLLGEVVRAGPSPVQTSFATAPASSLVAHLMKAPARLERAILRRAPDSPKLAWRWIGGWEVLIRLDGPRETK